MRGSVCPAGERREVAVRSLHAGRRARGARVLGDEGRVGGKVAGDPMDPAEASHWDGIPVQKRQGERARAGGHVAHLDGEGHAGMPVDEVLGGGVLAEAVGQQSVFQFHMNIHGVSFHARFIQSDPLGRRLRGSCEADGTVGLPRRPNDDHSRMHAGLHDVIVSARAVDHLAAARIDAAVLPVRAHIARLRVAHLGPGHEVVRGSDAVVLAG